MAKKSPAHAQHPSEHNAPETLKDHVFFGIALDEDQIRFRDAIWDDKYTAVFCNARAGTGKTLVAVATSLLLCQYGKYDGIIYVTAPTQEGKIGFLPGDQDAKTEAYNAPLYDAILKLNYDPNQIVVKDNMESQKSGNAIVQCMSHVFQRGINFENKVVIVDESQNFYFDELKKVLTRCHDSCKVIIVGHDRQCDLYKNPEHSGFVPYIEAAINCKHDSMAVCRLTINHRGWFSQWADDIELKQDNKKVE